MFRSGPLTRTRLNQIMRRAEATPHNLRVVAKACLILPADLLAWFAAGQDPQCRDPLMVELAWKINELRADVAARNYARIEAAASGGKRRKVVTEDDGTSQHTEEDVLPAAWAIEKIDQLAAASHWEISPDAQQAEELHRMMQDLSPTPLLGEGLKPEGGIPAIRPLAGGDGSGEVELREGGGHGPVNGGVHAAGGGANLDIAEKHGVGVSAPDNLVAGEGTQLDAKLDDVFHSQNIADPE